MCTLDPITGQITCYQNTFWSIARDMFSSTKGLLVLFIPLAIFIGGFFVFKHYIKTSRKILIIYAITALIIYVLLLVIFYHNNSTNFLRT